eukprot:gene188-3576_t
MDEVSDMSEHEIYGEQASLGTPLLENQNSSGRQDGQFAQMISCVEQAIEDGILPERIVQGSSGSYFCRNTNGDILGVFKPKNEEPYGHLNPKWGKWIQRHFCCWCYGRDCLPQNQGYLSEAGAWLVDDILGLNIVPKTRVVRLVSPSFHYTRFDRARASAVRSASRRFPETTCFPCLFPNGTLFVDGVYTMVGKRMRQGLPPKIGSFQTFVRGYQDASAVLQKIEFEKLQQETQASLLYQFQSLVVLDYLIRNTDRGNDNWLIKYTPPDEQGEGESIKIAAIDNGLSFPRKHPDNWRAYPYYWSWLFLANFKFTEQIADKLLPILRDEKFFDDLGDRLYALFSQDSRFSRPTFERQMSVIRGQGLNLTKALEQRITPAELVRLPPVTVVMTRPQRRGSSSSLSRRYRQEFTRRPFFQWF